MQTRDPSPQTVDINNSGQTTSHAIGIDPSHFAAARGSLREGETLDDLECCNMHIISNRELYKFTSDSVRLANLVRGSYKSRLLDMCTGSGIIAMLIAAKTSISTIHGVDIQPELCDIAQRSATLNNLSSRISYINQDINELVKCTTPHSYDIITCNPPYYRINSGESRLSPSAAMARHEVTITLEQIISSASRMLKYGGNFYIVHKCDRLAETLTLLTQCKLEPKELYLYSPTSAHVCDTFVAICKSNAAPGLIVKHCIIES